MRQAGWHRLALLAPRAWAGGSRVWSQPELQGRSCLKQQDRTEHHTQKHSHPWALARVLPPSPLKYSHPCTRNPLLYPPNKAPRTKTPARPNVSCFSWVESAFYAEVFWFTHLLMRKLPSVPSWGYGITRTHSLLPKECDYLTAQENRQYWLNKPMVDQEANVRQNTYLVPMCNAEFNLQQRESMLTGAKGMSRSGW